MLIYHCHVWKALNQHLYEFLCVNTFLCNPWCLYLLYTSYIYLPINVHVIIMHLSQWWLFKHEKIKGAHGLDPYPWHYCLKNIRYQTEERLVGDLQCEIKQVLKYSYTVAIFLAVVLQMVFSSSVNKFFHINLTCASCNLDNVDW